MIFFDNEDTSLNRFIFFSIMIHLILFFTYPQWSTLLISDSPGLEKGGVIQVVYSPESKARQISPITDPVSKTTIPQVEQPRPTSEPPKETAASTPTVSEEATTVEVPRPEPTVEPELEPKPIVESETSTEPEPVMEPESIHQSQPETIDSTTPAIVPEISTPTPELERPPVPDSGELLTSEYGREIAIDNEPESITTEVVKETKLDDAEPVEVSAPSQPIVEEIRPSSSSGTEIVGGESDNEAGIQESGLGEAEVAPPPPPPPPSGQSAHVGGRNPVYPKDAEHEGVEGTVKLDVTVSSSGQIIEVSLLQSSGDSRLDQQAIQTIRALWEFHAMFRDYVITLDVEFTQTLDKTFSSVVRYGESRWLE